MSQALTRDPIPPGTLDMLVLRTLARHGELHGFEIAEAIARISADVLQVEEGSLYPALQRMLLKGWVVGEWGRTGENRRQLSVPSCFIPCSAGSLYRVSRVENDVVAGVTHPI